MAPSATPENARRAPVTIAVVGAGSRGTVGFFKGVPL